MFTRRGVTQLTAILALIAVIFAIRTIYHRAVSPPTPAQVVASVLARPPVPEFPDPAGRALDDPSEHGHRQLDLYVFDLDTGAETRLTASVAREATIAWAPDGEMIAFSSNRPGLVSKTDIYAVTVDGSGFKKLTDTPAIHEYEAAWSPDRTRVAYSAPSDVSDDKAIYVMALETGEIDKVTTEGHSYRSPAWSPDGSALAIVVWTGNAGEIEMLDLNTGRHTRLTNHEQEGRYASDPDWSPDGRQLVYVVSKDPREDLYVLEIDSGTSTPIKTGMRLNRNPVWLNDGRISFTAPERDVSTAWVVNPDGSGLESLGANGSGQFTELVLSPRADKLAYLAWRNDPHHPTNSFWYFNGEELGHQSGGEETDLPHMAFAIKNDAGEWEVKELLGMESRVILENQSEVEALLRQSL